MLIYHYNKELFPVLKSWNKIHGKISKQEVVPIAGQIAPYNDHISFMIDKVPTVVITNLR